MRTTQQTNAELQDEEVKLPSATGYVPETNPHVMGKFADLLRNKIDADRLVTASKDEKHYRAERKRQHEEIMARVAPLPEETATALTGPLLTEKENQRTVPIAPEEETSRYPLLDSLRKLNPFSKDHWTPTVKTEDVKVTVQNVSEDLGVTDLLKSGLNRGRSLMDGPKDPLAAETYARIRQANAEYDLQQFLNRLEDNNPFLGKGSLQVNLQQMVTAMSLLNSLDPDAEDYAILSADLHDFFAVTKKLDRPFFQAMGYEVPLSIDSLDPGALAAQLGLYKPSSSELANISHEAGLLRETNGAHRFDTLQAYYQGIRQLHLARALLKENIANGAGSTEVEQAFAELWQNYNDFRTKLPEYLQERVDAGLIFDSQDGQRLHLPEEVTAFQLLAEYHRRNNPQSLSATRLAETSANLVNNISPGTAQALGEELLTNVSKIWTSDTTETFFGAAAGQLSNEQLIQALTDLEREHPAAVQQAKAVQFRLNGVLKHYDRLVEVWNSLPQGGEHESLRENLVGSVVAVNEAGTFRRVENEAFSRTMSEFDGVTATLQGILKDDLHADPKNLMAALREYSRLNESDPLLRAAARAAVLAFQEHFSLIVPELQTALD